MKKTALKKNAWREIWQSKARFFSILGIIFLGVGFFSGIKATGPDMLKTAENYYDKQHLADLSLQSSLGLTDEDLKLLNASPLIEKAEVTYEKDLIIPKTNEVMKVMGVSESNQVALTSGRLPKKSGEIALDYLGSQSDYKIGDKISLEDTSLKITELTIVGFVNSPLYIENVSRGLTNVGKGSVDFFGIILPEDFSVDYYPKIQISLKNMPKETYGKKYEEKRDKDLQEIKSLLKDRPKERLTEIKAEAEEKIQKGQQEIDAGKTQLADAEKALTTAKEQLDAGKSQLAEGKNTLATAIEEGNKKLAASKEQLEDSKAQLNQGNEQLQAAKKEIEEKEAELNAAETTLNEQQKAFNEKLTQWEKVKAQGEKANEQMTQLLNGLEPLNSSLSSILALSNETPEEQEIFTTALKSWAQNTQENLGSLSSGGNFSTFQNLTDSITALETTPNEENANNVKSSLNNFSSEVSQTLELSTSQLADGQNQIDAGEAQLQEALDEFNAGKMQLEEGKAQLAQQEENLKAAERQIEEGQTQLAAGENELAEQKASGEQTLKEQEEKLAEAEKQYNEGVAKYQTQQSENLPKLQEAQNELEKSKNDLNTLSAGEYFYFTRDDNPGFTEFAENAQRITNIATVFPVLFFLIAALVSFTTMTRMVEEKRGEIGTLKALGYKTFEISQKYLLYAGLSALIGATLGIVVGNFLFPGMIFNAYGSLYNLPKIVLAWYPLDILIAFLVALACTVGSSLVALRVDLLNVPATLMRPKAPKQGKRIILERIKFIWKRLGFTQKVTIRNLFRYKARAFMTILGIAGCMSLMITGFGLRDSIGDIVNLQFNKLWHYQGIVTFNKEGKTPEEASEQAANYQKALDQVENLKDTLKVGTVSLEKNQEGVNPQDVTVYVPETPNKLDKFVLFNDRKTGEQYTLNDEGAIISEKLANLFHLTKGDTLTLRDTEGQEYELKISAVVENYAMHFAYVTPRYYEEIFKTPPVFNSQFLLFNKSPTESEESSIANNLMKESNVLNVSFLSETSKAMDDTMGSLNIVVWVLIISAALLAFIVLYNLTNINISERIRELSTIKVLGFYDEEVTMYIYRENIILTLIGILVGCLLGIGVHKFVLQTVEVDLIMFGPNIHFLSFIYASLLTILFTLLVMYFMHKKLQHVDMIEALKSNE